LVIGIKWPGLDADHSVPELGLDGFLPPFCVCIVWCALKHS
jgi:hypothetical protein